MGLLIAKIFSLSLSTGNSKHYLSFVLVETFYISEYIDLLEVVHKLAIYNQFESLEYCDSCNLMATNKMLPNYGNQQTQYHKDYNCKRGPYHVPMVTFNVVVTNWVIVKYSVKICMIIIRYRFPLK